MKLIEQRTPTDCSICSLAMYLDRTYEEIMDIVNTYDPNIARRIQDGVYGLDIISELHIIRHFGGNTVCLLTFPQSLKCFLAVASLNFPGKLHAVAYDGNEVFDPSLYKKHNKTSILYGIADVITEYNQDSREIIEYEESLGLNRPI